MRNVHNPVKATKNLISNFLQESLEKNTQPVTNQDYMTRMANEIIDGDVVFSMENRHMIRIPKHKPVWFKSISNEIDRLSQGVGGRVEGNDKKSAPQQYTWKQRGKCDVCEDCCGLPPKKGWAISYSPHSRRQRNQIFRGCHHTNSRSDNSNIIGQQYYFNPRIMIHVLRHKIYILTLTWNTINIFASQSTSYQTK